MIGDDEVEKAHCLRLARTLGHDWTEGDLAHRFEIERAAVRGEAGMLHRVLEHELDGLRIEVKALDAQNRSLYRAVVTLTILWVLSMSLPWLVRVWTLPSWMGL